MNGKNSSSECHWRTAALPLKGKLRQTARSVGATTDRLVPHGALNPMLARVDARRVTMIAQRNGPVRCGCSSGYLRIMRRD